MPYSDALHMKAILTEELERHAPFRTYLDNVTRSMVSASQKQKAPMPWRTGEEVRQALLGYLLSSETFYISPDMTSVAIAAAESLPLDSVVLPQHVPTLRGFLWLPEPVRVYDVRNQILSLNAVAWSVENGGVHVWWLTDKYDKVDSSNLFLLNAGHDISTWPRLSPMHYARIRFNTPLPSTVQLKGQKIIPPDVEVTTRREGDALVISINDDGMTQEDLELVEAPAKDLRFLTVVWRLMGQTLADVREETRMPKATRRLVQRTNLPDSKVSVILLRHKSRPTDGHREVQWTHRWLVRGYWRRQWYGSGENRYSDDIWIHPHIKGPEGAPILIRDHINALVR